VIKQESRAYFRALGAHISELRKEQGMTQAELARALGVSQQTVFAYELGDRRVSVLIVAKLAKIFGVSIEEMIGMTRIPRPGHRRLSPAGTRHAQRFQQLSKTEQRFVKKIMDVLLERGPQRCSIEAPKSVGAD
jgi:transcriptional regulator with XRE-family HTH domain